ncbi:MAG: hypothetical protein JST27_05010 [Bacteroidetes bacterium]|nr:hypothetical protein [Bacteroidota bacterium]
MKKIIGYLSSYFREQLNFRYLVVLILFIALAVYLNFYVRSEDDWIKADPDALRRLLKYILGYACMFGGAYALLLPFDKDRSLRSLKLWSLIGFAVLLFAVRAWLLPDWAWLAHRVPTAYLTLSWKIIVNATGFVLLFIPCTLFWLLADRHREPLYGFHAKGVVLWPYFVLIALMLPLIIAAGMQPAFQSVYPRAAHLGLVPGNPHRMAATLAYEGVYSFDYVVTEFFFRGFLILPFSRIAGPRVILPMCAFYVSIHFDKPLGECISSFFGGLVLGILSWRTRSIYGGVIVHLGIALAMECVGGLL